MNDLDKRLHDLGERWRGTQQDPPPADPEAFRDLISTRPARSAYQNGAGLLIIMLVLGGIVVGRGFVVNQAGPRGNAAGGIDAGDEVVATGVIVAAPDGVTRICDPFVVDLGGGSVARPVECGPISALVRGLQAKTLPGWTELGGGGYSSLVTVSGTWEGHALEARSVSAAPTPIPTPPQVPCETPVEGWPASGTSEIDYEAALRRLGDELRRNATRFTDYWTAFSTGAVGDARVIVVGTVDNPADVGGSLEALFPYPLCVVNATYSAADLDRAAQLLSRPDGTWEPQISNERNRVVVRLAVVDTAAQALFDAHPEAIADPLVRRK